MLRRPGFLAAIILPSLLAGPAAAAYMRIDMDPYTAPLPPSGRYLDPATSLVYDYNNATGALVATVETASFAQFVCVETYGPGNASTCAAAAAKPAAGLCTTGHACIPTCSGYRVCGAATAAVVGSHALQLFAVVSDCNGITTVPWGNDHRSEIVSYLRLPIGVKSDCPTGSLEMRLLMDNLPAGTASGAYS